MSPESCVIFFPCTNLEETLHYYRDILAFPVYKQLPATVWFDCGSGYLAFVQYDDGRPLASGACISFNLKDNAAVDAQYRLLQQQAGVIGLKAAPAMHPRFPVYSFFLSDPNGYTLEYQKVAD